MSELLNCPFCNHKMALKVVAASEIFADDDEEPSPYMHTESYAVICDASKPNGPGGCGGQGGFKPTPELAVEAWNHRAVEASPASQPQHQPDGLAAKANP